MKQYFVCPKCKKKLVHTGREQWSCLKCGNKYRVPNYQRITIWFINIVIMAGALIGLIIGLMNL